MTDISAEECQSVHCYVGIRRFACRNKRLDYECGRPQITCDFGCGVSIRRVPICGIPVGCVSADDAFTGFVCLISVMVILDYSAPAAILVLMRYNVTP